MKWVLGLIVLSFWIACLGSNFSGLAWAVTTFVAGALFVGAVFLIHHEVNRPRRRR